MTNTETPRKWTADEIDAHANYLVSKFYSEDLRAELNDMLSYGPGERAVWSDLIAATRRALEV